MLSCFSRVAQVYSEMITEVHDTWVLGNFVKRYGTADFWQKRNEPKEYLNDFYAYKALYIAVYTSRKTAEALLEKIPDLLNAKAKHFGYSVLHEAAKRGHVEVFNYILQKRADLLNSRDNGPRYGILVAGGYAFPGIVRAALQAKNFSPELIFDKAGLHSALTMAGLHVRTNLCLNLMVEYLENTAPKVYQAFLAIENNDEERFEQLYQENQEAFAKENEKVALLDRPLVEGWDGMIVRLLSMPHIVTTINPYTLKKRLTASLAKPASALKEWLMRAFKAQQETTVSAIADVQGAKVTSEKLEKPVEVQSADMNPSIEAFIDKIAQEHVFWFNG